MTRLGFRICAILFFVNFMAFASSGQEAKKTKGAGAKASSSPPSAHKVERGRFKIDVDFEGVFEPVDTWPVALDSETWSSFTVMKAVEHGEQVDEGETLVEFETSKIDDQLQDLKQELTLARLSRRLAETELELLKKTTPIDLKAAERNKEIAREELEYFLETAKAFQEEMAKQMLKSARNSLEYAREELEQLEKMYKADDLTEETEEIVLKRARHQVERAEFSLKAAELRTRRTLKQELPREEKQLREMAKRAEIAAAKATRTVPAEVKKKQIELDKQRLAIKRSQEKLEKLQQDRKLMTVTAPADGYVYYGEWTRGKWSGSDSAASKLVEDGTVSPKSVFMTIVNLRPMRIRVDVPEKKLHLLSRGAQATAVPTGYPELELTATLQHVSSVPISKGSFEGWFQMALGDDADPVVPGMQCKVTLVAYDKKDAIAVPAGAVFEDDADGERNIVYVKRDEGEPEKREIKIGRKTEQKWEVLQGLEEDEEILLKKPNAS